MASKPVIHALVILPSRAGGILKKSASVWIPEQTLLLLTTTKKVNYFFLEIRKVIKNKKNKFLYSVSFFTVMVVFSIKTPSKHLATTSQKPPQNLAKTGSN